MWRRLSTGSWTQHQITEEEENMSDSADEYREALEGATLQIGDSVVAYTYPLTEGLIIDRRNSEEGRLALTLLIGPYKKKGQNWSRTKVSLRDAARLSKKPPSRFVFPIKGIDKLREEAKKFKSDPVWVAAVKAALDEDFQQREPFSEDSDLDEKEEAGNLGELERTTDSQQRNEEEVPAAQRFAELQKRVGEILKLKVDKDNGKKKKKPEKEDEDSDFEEWKKWKREKLKRKQKNKKKRSKTPASSSASSSSSSSSSEEEPRKGEVREKGSTALFTCPFHRTDARGVKDVKGYIQGQEVTRKNVRVALHNLYAAHYTLVSFADKFVGKAYASPYRPYTMDVNWFQAYAENIDELLLNSIQGPWALWNEPQIDQLVIGFLELMIRVSPHKNYPVCLDDSVRKWMKRKRIGTDTKYGPVSYSMQHAKFTEAGVVVHQTGGQRGKEKPQNFNTRQGGNNTGNRVITSPPTGGDKRPPPSN